jgi:superfamily II DNA or RNA helicase
MVVDDIVGALEQNRFPLILSDRRDHLDLLFEELKKRLVKTRFEGFLLTSDAGKKQRGKILVQIAEMLNRGELPYLLSTGALIGEGFDLPELSTLVLAMPIAFKGRIIQYAGRIHRVSPGKTEVQVYDYVDSNLGLCISMFKKRLTAYRKMGYSIEVNEKSKLYNMVNSRRKKMPPAANN